MPFTCQQGDLKSIFITEAEIIDRYVGNQLWAWGNGSTGAMGDNYTVNRSRPVQTISGGTNWRQVSVGCSHTAAIKTDGTLWLWGTGGQGRLGNNTIYQRNSPVQTISGGTNWKQACAGVTHTAAVKTDGTLWTWGSNFWGQLGTNSYVSASSPVQTVSGGTNWRQVSVGSDNTAAIKTDGTLWTWGLNCFGQLGINDTAVRKTPVQTISGSTNWKQVDTGSYHTAAIKTNGELWAWGYGSGGRLGNGCTTNRSSPVQIAGTTWKQVSAGSSNTAAIKTDGTLWIWGVNSIGSIGDTTNFYRSSPVQTISGGTNWKQVSVGSVFVSALKTDGTLWSWGKNFSGEIGDNTTAHRSSPVQIVSCGTNWKQVSSGSFNTAAVTFTET